jgi:hypothetical protein
VASSRGAPPSRYQMLAERFGAPRNGAAHTGERRERSCGRWAETSAGTRAAIVAGCFELCTAAAQAPASPAMEASVMSALAASALQLEAWDVGRRDGGSGTNAEDAGISGRESESSSHRRLAVLQWVTARATECAALRAAVPALALAATLLLGLPTATAAACTPMLVTAHASAALWGHAEDFADVGSHGYNIGAGGGESGGGGGGGGELLQLAREETSQEQMTSVSVGGLSTEQAQRAGLLQTAHKLSLECNGGDAALSMIADVMHVVSSAADPVSAPAASTATAVALCLLASHVRGAVANARGESLKMERGSQAVAATSNDCTRLGGLVGRCRSTPC